MRDDLHLCCRPGSWLLALILLPLSFLPQQGTAQYCNANTVNGPDGFTFVRGVRFHNIDDQPLLSTLDYLDRTGFSTPVVAGQYHHMSVSIGPTNPFNTTVGVWIDWNQDGDFDDTDEFIGKQGFTASNSVFSFYFTVPAGASLGNTRMRVRAIDSPLSETADFEPCHTYTFGQTKDYTVDVQPSMGPQPCQSVATGPGVNGSANTIDTDAANVHITNVSLSSINNNSMFFGTTAGPFNYSNNTWINPPTIEAGMNYTVNVSNTFFTGFPASVGVWIDWNQDGEFGGPNETIGTASNATGTHSFNFTAPNTIVDGQNVLMRVRVLDSDGMPATSLTACNNAAGGTFAGQNNETEDYRLLLSNPFVCSTPSLAPTLNGVSGTAGFCPGEDFSLDAGATGGNGCSGSFEYAWSDGTNFWDGSGFNSATPVFNTAFESITVPSGAAGTYTAQVQCSTDPSCNGSASVDAVQLGSVNNLSAAIGTPPNGTNHHLDVSWDAVAGASDYELEFSTDGGSTWTALGTVNGTNFDHDLVDQPNIPVLYRVRPLPASGTATACSFTEMATPRYTAADVPAAPSLTNLTNTTLDLDLVPETPVANPSVTDYAIQEQNTGQWLQPDGTLGATKAFQEMSAWNTTTVTGLTPGMEYCFVATAQNEDGDERGGVGATIRGVEPFDTDVINNVGPTGPNNVWWSPNTCTGGEDWDWTGANGCPAGAAEFSDNFLNFGGCFLRSPTFDATGLDEIVMRLDVSNEIYTTSPDDALQFYLFIDGATPSIFPDQTQVPISINGTPGRFIDFDVARNCESFEIRYDLTGANGNLSDVMLYIETRPADGSEVYTARVDNIELFEAAPTACATLPTCPTSTQPTATWTGTDSRDWFDCDNWDIGEIPGPSTTAIITSATTPPNQPLIDDSTTTAGALVMDGPNLDIMNGGELSLNDSLRLDDGLVITDGTSELNLTNGATDALKAFGNTSYVNGRLRRSLSGPGNYDLPVGGTSAGAGYQFARVELTTLGTSTEILASFNATPVTGALPGALSVTECDSGLTPYNTWVDNGYWNLTTDGSGESYDLFLRPNPSSYSATIRNADYTPVTGNAAATIAKRPDGGAVTAFNLDGSCAFSSNLNDANGPVEVGRLGLSGFSEFTVITDNLNPLPVELLGLEARPAGDAIELSWATATEQNNRGFHIQRTLSPDQDAFTGIGWREGSGSTTSQTSYSFTDTDVRPGRTYFYRLQQEDLNGGVEYSNVVSAQLTPGGLLLRVFPNPTRELATLSLEGLSGSATPVEASVMDATGRRVFVRRTRLEGAEGSIELDLSGLASGVYSLRVNADGEQFIRRLVKVE